MRQYKIALLNKQFPFLDLVAKKLGPLFEIAQCVDDINIKRADENFLTQTGYEDSYDWSGGGFHNYKRHFAICGKVVQLDGSIDRASGSGERYSEKADPIGEQLFAKGLRPEFIVECVEHDTDANGNGTPSHFWTIYKMEKFDLAKFHGEQIDRAAALLKSEIAAACGVV